ncbi:hypothetical protein B0H10DRAFT_1947291 [Mycena sp. CBHHK59/15]|nr:hypothetical protein B0H10DRAFT_1947291 [Mycena sp. CBHHK59/15]
MTLQPLHQQGGSFSLGTTPMHQSSTAGPTGNGGSQKHKMQSDDPPADAPKAKRQRQRQHTFCLTCNDHIGILKCIQQAAQHKLPIPPSFEDLKTHNQFLHLEESSMCLEVATSHQTSLPLIASSSRQASFNDKPLSSQLVSTQLSLHFVPPAGMPVTLVTGPVLEDMIIMAGGRDKLMGPIMMDEQGFPTLSYLPPILCQCLSSELRHFVPSPSGRHPMDPAPLCQLQNLHPGLQRHASAPHINYPAGPALSGYPGGPLPQEQPQPFYPQQYQPRASYGEHPAQVRQHEGSYGLPREQPQVLYRQQFQPREHT